jgi:3-hydroxyacyl-CoA dehydrogenase/enoyl-CoA hydratase/3-hydroxybutyryl-CoA epimerase
VNPVVTGLAEAGPESTPPAAPQAITYRLMGVMIDEAKRCLAEGVIKSPDDVDFALLRGAGFPAARGGLMRYARASGLA